jgi:TolB-like protein
MVRVARPGASDDAPAGVGQPSPEEVRAQLARITASLGSSIPDRLHAFLRHVVEETLAGRGERIKAYTIAVEVFGRDATFDAHADPAVRIEAGRLRRALEHHYLSAGRADPVLIDIPKGGYTPVFAFRPVATASATPAVLPGSWRRWPWIALATAAALALSLGTFWGFARAPPAPVEASVVRGGPGVPTLVVVPFDDLGDGPISGLHARGLTEELLTQLAPFKELTVLGRDTSRSLPPQPDVARFRGLGARFALEGGVRAAAGRVRITARLLDTQTSAVLWSQAYDRDLSVHDLVATQEDIAGQVATKIAHPYGVIARVEAQRSAGLPDDLDAYACTLRFYDYRVGVTPELHLLVRGCLERATGLFPRYATAWAMLADMYLDEDRFGYNAEPGARPPLDRALDAARRAVALDPDNTRALQMLMLALYFRGAREEALRIGEQALALNPNDTELLGEFGGKLSDSGEWERGTALIRRALALNPAAAGYYHAELAFNAYIGRDYGRAKGEIEQASFDENGVYHCIAAIIYAQLGMAAEAHREVARFAALAPAFAANIEPELAKRMGRPEDIAHVIDGLRKAGLPVPADTIPAGRPATPPG